MQVCLLHKNTQKTNVTENNLTILKMTTSIQLIVSGGKYQILYYKAIAVTLTMADSGM